jgi:lipopolysaccharide/colanic/teichoic acid biosynthesis glycosyltransferase
MTDFDVTSDIQTSPDQAASLSLDTTRLLSLAVLARDLETRELDTPMRRINLALKRVMDVAGSLVALVMLSPLLIAAAIAIRLESSGPIFFIQERWGKDCRRIKVLKFRSMYAHACDHSGIAQTVEGDSRITRVGAFLRRTNIDELPQLINVLKGDMSLVGPRCHVMGMKAAGMNYEELVPQYHLRHVMRPGITGLAQMRGLRGPTVEARHAIRRVRSDLEYITTFNILLDIAICFKTVWHELFKGGRGV